MKTTLILLAVVVAVVYADDSAADSDLYARGKKLAGYSVAQQTKDGNLAYSSGTAEDGELSSSSYVGSYIEKNQPQPMAAPAESEDTANMENSAPPAKAGDEEEMKE